MPDTTGRPTAGIAFIDLKAQQERVGEAIGRAVARVLAHGRYILGPEVEALESALAAFCGAGHVVACANGTDALQLVLMAKGIGAGDAIVCPSFTFAATAEVVALVGATPVFADIRRDSFNLDPASAAEAVKLARGKGLRPAGIIAVDLFGRPADYAEIEPLCAAEGLWLLSDAAQSFGASYRGRKVGTIGMATGISFFPAKPLGCYGDGGAVFTDDPDLAGLIRSIAVHGQGRDRYQHPRVGLNSRLDTIQAAILLEKLNIFPEEIAARDRVARRYHERLSDRVEVPAIAGDSVSVWAQYTLRLGGRDRDVFRARLAADGVPTAVYYPTPLHRQPAYASAPVAGGRLPVTEALAGEVVSLPMHPYLAEDTQDFIIDAVRRALT